MRWIALGVALGLAVVAVGCDPAPGNDASVVYETLCQCIAFLPAQQDKCLAEIDTALPNVAAACADCVEREAGDCASEIQVCVPICDQAQQQPGPRAPAVTEEDP